MVYFFIAKMILFVPCMLYTHRLHNEIPQLFLHKPGTSRLRVTDGVWPNGYKRFNKSLQKFTRKEITVFIAKIYQ